MTRPATDHRRAVAERNAEAIRDAAELLLERRSQASVAAVAAQAGVSRVTVYAHYATREQLLEAVVERAVRRSAAALDAAALDTASALDALDRLVAASWRELDRNHAIAQAAAERLTSEALARAHEAAHGPVLRLVERGCAHGTFRTDVPAGWLVTSLFALMHAAGDDVRAGRMDAVAALHALRTTVRGVFAGT